MLSSAGTGSCAYASPGCRHGSARESSSTSLAAAASWWSADASTSPVINPARRLAAAASDDASYRADGCTWEHGGHGGLIGDHYHVLTDEYHWTTNVDDLLPTSETYKWMTVRRSRTKTGTFHAKFHYAIQLANWFASWSATCQRAASC